MALLANANPLPPPPLTGNARLDAWMREVYRKIGQATDTIALNTTGDSDNITGILASANAAANLIKNQTNDAMADSIDAGANATVRVYGSGGVGSNWSRYRNGVLVASHAAVTFTGKAYTTRYYIGYDVITGTWTISTAYKDVTGDNMIVFSVQTVASGGGGGVGGGGGSGSGGSGGVGGGGGGYGVFL